MHFLKIIKYGFRQIFTKLNVTKQIIAIFPVPNFKGIEWKF
jgi:hypothetical protein